MNYQRHPLGLLDVNMVTVGEKTLAHSQTQTIADWFSLNFSFILTWTSIGRHLSSEFFFDSCSPNKLQIAIPVRVKLKIVCHSMYFETSSKPLPFGCSVVKASRTTCNGDAKINDDIDALVNRREVQDL